MVAAQDPRALADAIASLLYDEQAFATAAAAAAEVRSRFRWDRALEPLLAFCAAPRTAPDRELMAESGSALGGNRFERILAMPRGRRRDIALLAYYLRRGGIPLVREKLIERRARLTRDD